MQLVINLQVIRRKEDSVKRFLALVAASVVLSLTAFVGSAAADPPGDGAFVITPPGLGGDWTATCVGPVFGETPPQAGLAPWEGHFNGVAVIHFVPCDPV